MEEITKSSQTIFKGKIINLRIDEVILPNGKISTREVVEHPGAVVIIPCLKDKIVVLRQYRKPVEEVLFELPAGKIEQGEDPLKSAARELFEETGYQAEKLIKLTTFYTSPGFSNEIMHLFLAQELHMEHQQLDQDEFLEVGLYSLDELISMILENKIKDAKTIVGLFWLKMFKAGE